MRLYSLTGASAIDAPEGHYEPDDTGGFDHLPGAVFERLHGMAVKGRKHWETEVERGDRVHSDELARKRDPASVHDALSELAAVTKQLAQLQLSQAKDRAPADAPAKSEPEVKPEPKPEPKADPEPEAKPEVKTPVKRGPAAKDPPAG